MLGNNLITLLSRFIFIPKTAKIELPKKGITFTANGKG